MSSRIPWRFAAIPLVVASAAMAQAHSAPIVIDTERIVAQARDAARDVQQEIARHVRQLTDDLKDLDFDVASLAFVASEFGGRTEIVKNAPYTAEAVTENVQVLSDGNRIVKTARALLARDSLGRTRQEKLGRAGATIYLFDPIEGRNYALNPEKRTAMRIPRVPAPAIPPLPPLPETEALPPAPPAPPTPPAPKAGRIEIHPGQVIVRKPSSDREDDVAVQVVRMGRGEGPLLGAPAGLTLPLLPRGKGETRSLGTREFGGVKAEGTQTTHTIAAGEIGNEKPIVIASERWFSPELHIVVFARTVDPRVGESSYRLVNLKREEPPADLFKVPSDYKGRGLR
jgi:hypothetical protein